MFYLHTRTHTHTHTHAHTQRGGNTHNTHVRIGQVSIADPDDLLTNTRMGPTVEVDAETWLNFRYDCVRAKITCRQEHKKDED